MDTVAADVHFEVKFFFTWLLMLDGVYMSWTLGSATESFVPGDDGADDFPRSDGLVQWLHQQCTGREERAAMNRDPRRLERYRQLKICLRDMLNFLHHATPMDYQRAHEMLHMIGDLSEDEASPTGIEDERVNLGPIAAASIAAGMTLAGCDSDGKSQGEPMVNFQTAVLLGWTALCRFQGRTSFVR
eukprot:s2334_g14.t1